MVSSLKEKVKLFVILALKITTVIIWLTKERRLSVSRDLSVVVLTLDNLTVLEALTLRDRTHLKLNAPTVPLLTTAELD
jgi:hypothetical protein